jgi:biopolymer transport protein ExbD
MLATKFKPAEPVVVRTPSSVSEIQVPENTCLLSIDKQGRIFMDYDNKDAKRLLIDSVNTEKGLGLSDEEKETFIKGAAIGAPFAGLKQYLASSDEERKMMPNLGIPVPTDSGAYYINNNELAYWVYHTRLAGDLAAQAAGVADSAKKPVNIAIKCDAGLQYPGFKAMIKTLQRNDLNSYLLVTNVEGVPENTALYKERFLNEKPSSPAN